MNVIWIVADTFRRDHLGAYGNEYIRTPSLDALASRSVRFDGHYAGGFPTMPTRADHATGRWTMSYMGWEPMPEGDPTLAGVLAGAGFHTAAVVDTPFYIRGAMDYDRGFQTFFKQLGQEGSVTRVAEVGNHESRDVRASWRYESDCNAPQTFISAMKWLERHHKEDFFLYVDTWDPHEPWDAPPYYTELYYPGYDGEIVQPRYGFWKDYPGLTEEKVKKAHAAYCGEITMVDTWIGHLLRHVDNLGLAEKTAIIFTSDHGFYFGEHGGLFGKMTFAQRPDGTYYEHGDADSQWSHSPLYEELTTLPLLVHVPGIPGGDYKGLSSVVDAMPTVLDILGQKVPDWVDGRSLLPAMKDSSTKGREFTVTTVPFANPGDRIRSVDNVSRMTSGIVTTVTTDDWAFLYSTEEGTSELYNLKKDPGQQSNVIHDYADVAKEHHQYLVRFMRETNLAPHLLNPRLELKL